MDSMLLKIIIGIWVIIIAVLSTLAVVSYLLNSMHYIILERKGVVTQDCVWNVHLYVIIWADFLLAYKLPRCLH